MVLEPQYTYRDSKVSKSPAPVITDDVASCGISATCCPANRPGGAGSFLLPVAMVFILIKNSDIKVEHKSDYHHSFGEAY